MWATIVDRDGIVCAVAFSGVNRGAQWPGSRVISAQKANTANSFSLDASSNSGGSGQAKGLALSTANLCLAMFSFGGSLFGLQESNPVDTGVAYKGPSQNYGAANDPMVGQNIGGVNVFGGGFALYAAGPTASAPAQIVGGVGVSGDTSCSDHFIGWRVRHNLGLDRLANIAGVAGESAIPRIRTTSFMTSSRIPAAALERAQAGTVILLVCPRPATPPHFPRLCSNPGHLSCDRTYGHGDSCQSPTHGHIAPGHLCAARTHDIIPLAKVPLRRHK